MSAGICGKRVDYEEIFGSSSSPSQYSSAKKPRRSGYTSPSRSEPGFVSDGSVSVLLQMFPVLDPEVVERVFRNNGCKIENCIECLGAISSGDIHEVGIDNLHSTDSTVNGNFDAEVDQNQGSRMWEETTEEKMGASSTASCELSTEGVKWVDLFVNEMMNATDPDDARRRAAGVLEAFERCVREKERVSDELKRASLKEHLLSLLNDNQILKRAVAIQHERNLEQEEKAKGVEQLKNVLNQYQEKVRSLELNNYALKFHLQRAQGSNSISGQFLPDVF